MALDLSSVDWVALGKGVGVAAAAGLTAAGTVRRMLKKGLGDLLRPVVTREVSRAFRETEKAMREDHEALAERVTSLNDRVSRVEGSLTTLTRTKHGPHDS